MPTSQRKLAEALGVAPATVAGYVKRPDWPVRRRAPWSAADVERIKAWQQQLQEDRSGKSATAAERGDDPGGTSIRTLAKGRLEWHRARREKIKADREERLVIDYDLHERAVAGVARMCVHIVSDAIEALPHQLDGDAPTNEAILRRYFADAFNRIISQAQIDLDQVDEAIEARLTGRAKARGRRGAGGGSGA